MQKLLLYSFSLCCFVFTLGCKQSNASANDSKQIEPQFKKEGHLQLYNTTTDSIIKTFDIEIADNEYETQTGLMYRRSLKKDQAMLFIFPKEEYRSFYMKNTIIPLDIIYIDSEFKIVSIQKNTTPFNETALPSEAPVKYVLEINAGLCNQLNIKPGNSISFKQDN